MLIIILKFMVYYIYYDKLKNNPIIYYKILCKILLFTIYIISIIQLLNIKLKKLFLNKLFTI